MGFRGFIIVSNYWTRVLSAGRAEAITLFPFVLVKNEVCKMDQRLLNHEAIHIRQALELGIIPFYLWYLIEFLYHWTITKNFDKAYRCLSFEKEAYENEMDPFYLHKRKFWRFLEYL